MKRELWGGKREKGFALLTTTAAVFLLIPAVGLAIDAGFLYAVKAKLSASADAAALAAARSLNRGLSLGEQAGSATTRALTFFDANFPEGFLGTWDRDTTVDVAETAYRTRTVSVDSAIKAPLYFMRIFGREYSDIAAGSAASRRDVNLLLVLDRSWSMWNSGSCEPMKAAARTFVEQFANGRDRLGLLTFGASYSLAYAPSMDFKTDSPSLDTRLNDINCGGNTSTAMALSEAYEELLAINEPGSLNIIIFFTDGLPNGITADYQVKTDTDTRYGYGTDSYNSTSTQYSIAPSSCEDADGDRYDRDYGSGVAQYGPGLTGGWNPNWTPDDKRGVLTQWAGFAATGTTAGLFKPIASSPSTASEAAIADSAGCRFGANRGYVRRDVAFIPEQDVYGNATRGYKNVETLPGGAYAGKIRPDTPTSIGSASFNSADNAAQRIRDDDLIDPVIYTIGLGDPTGVEPPDEELMKRIANDRTSPIFDPDEPAGMYVFAPDNTQLADAFSKIASEVLRISR